MRRSAPRRTLDRAVPREPRKHDGRSAMARCRAGCAKESRRMRMRSNARGPGRCGAMRKPRRNAGKRCAAPARLRPASGRRSDVKVECVQQTKQNWNFMCAHTTPPFAHSPPHLDTLTRPPPRPHQRVKNPSENRARAPTTYELRYSLTLEIRVICLARAPPVVCVCVCMDHDSCPTGWGSTCRWRSSPCRSCSRAAPRRRSPPGASGWPRSRPSASCCRRRCRRCCTWCR